MNHYYLRAENWRGSISTPEGYTLTQIEVIGYRAAMASARRMLTAGARVVICYGPRGGKLVTK
jgi:hypothetical protein